MSYLKHTYLKNIGIALFFVFVICLMAQVSFTIPLSNLNIPITGQTFAVLLTGFFLGPKKGALVVLAYIILGIIGLPVFANGTSGLEKITGNTGGFILGFIPGVIFTGYRSKKGIKAVFLHHFMLMLIGTAIIVFCGFLMLSTKIGAENAYSYGVYPFLLGGVIKSILGAIISLLIQTSLPKLITR
jgi:biotin transport system substrate-specific component